MNNTKKSYIFLLVIIISLVLLISCNNKQYNNYFIQHNMNCFAINNNVTALIISDKYIFHLNNSNKDINECNFKKWYNYSNKKEGDNLCPKYMNIIDIGQNNYSCMNICN